MYIWYGAIRFVWLNSNGFLLHYMRHGRTVRTAECTLIKEAVWKLAADSSKQRSSVMSDLRVEIEKEPVQGDTNRSRVKNRVGLVATCALGGSLVALYAVAGPFIAPALRKTCLPFVPATNTQVKNVLRALQSRSGTLVDIGSGDGRIVSDFPISFIFKWQSFGAEELLESSLVVVVVFKCMINRF